jgi:hypothetical protein
MGRWRFRFRVKSRLPNRTANVAVRTHVATDPLKERSANAWEILGESEPSIYDRCASAGYDLHTPRVWWLKFKLAQRNHSHSGGWERFRRSRLQLKATGTYRDGSTQGLTSSATWTSSITGVATITSPGGLATGVSPGTTEITAASGAVSSGPVELTVMIAPTLTSIAVAPPNASLEVGATLQFSAIGTYDDGSTQILTSQVIWSSSDTTVATIASGGLATGAAPGTTTIEASLSGLSGTAILTVDAE